jgi:hypothetical protein
MESLIFGTLRPVTWSEVSLKRGGIRNEWPAKRIGWGPEAVSETILQSPTYSVKL